MAVLLGNGDGTFGSPTSFPAGTHPWSVAVGKLNGDSHLDLVVANVGDGFVDDRGSVSVLLGKGDGTFGAAKDFTAGIGPADVAIGNLNGDNHPDLAVANWRSNNVSVLLGKGNGAFAARKDFASGANPTSVAIGNLNRDSHRDLAVANSGSTKVSVLLGKGNGRFAARRNFAVGKGPNSVAIGRFNSGRDRDLAVANNERVAVLLKRRPQVACPDAALPSRPAPVHRAAEFRRPRLRQGAEGEGAAQASWERPQGRRCDHHRLGTYSISNNAEPGTYYAKVRAWSACRDERSKAITVR